MPMKIKNDIINQILFIVFFATLPAFFPKEVLADGISLNISPSLLRIEAKPPADVWTPFIIENSSNQTVNLKIGYKAFDPQSSQNGNVVFLKNDYQVARLDKNIFEKMQIVDDNNISYDTISLGPRQKERFRLRILLPQNELASDYYFSLIFLQNPEKQDQTNAVINIEDQKSFSTLQAGIGINILLAVGDKTIPQGTIDTFTTSWFQESGPIPFTLTVHNSGIHFFTPQGKIFIKNMFGQTIGKIIIPPSVVLSGTNRTLTGIGQELLIKNLIPSSTSFNQYDSPSLIWPEHFLFGFYTANLSLSLSDIGPTYTRNIHFLILPIKLLVELLVIIVIIGVIYLRVKKKIS
ncbi:MAG TPA: hypothetical protein VNW29_00895 [Candidatus Sulfotelmatobacter sp.]|jgi:hypothetical protein|nr:hypothetical protein [Candidatus Sulfotelmatobacter sp.]